MGVVEFRTCTVSKIFRPSYTQVPEPQLGGTLYKPKWKDLKFIDNREYQYDDELRFESMVFVNEAIDPDDASFDHPKGFTCTAEQIFHQFKGAKEVFETEKEVQELVHNRSMAPGCSESLHDNFDATTRVPKRLRFLACDDSDTMLVRILKALSSRVRRSKHGDKAADEEDGGLTLRRMALKVPYDSAFLPVEMCEIHNNVDFSRYLSIRDQKQQRKGVSNMVWQIQNALRATQQTSRRGQVEG
ncbi:hypothetical protein BDP27DRAFT_1367302 [Rhodocollybia butyracea]|uniref:Uncharacterized protein n=1 Tax=Rhodocollybia butyracea TaxID=206335 RepID=A0A9P5U382_9AGAR|nr:hypothetical protein BDP27DRAFT_1367302 [Rhodocollybia butyracea]